MSNPRAESPTDPRTVRDILEWDVATWSAAVEFWEPFLERFEHAKVLELGAKNGGLSLHFALKGHDVVCSDLNGPSPKAADLHRRYGVSSRVTYESVDGTSVKFPDNLFDIVCFKSVLGGIGYSGRFDLQKQAILEVYRVLRPNGLLLFAENLTSTWFHKFSREHYLSYGRKWRYISLPEVSELLRPFRRVETSCHGFLAAFGRTERQRSFLNRIDRVLEPILPDRAKYVIAGVAEKSQRQPQQRKEETP